jgi:prephenate dehydrogenase
MRCSTWHVRPPVRSPAVTTERQPCANVVGLGLIGGSIAVALRERGWYVSGEDPDTARATAAMERGVVDSLGIDPDAEISFVAAPVLVVPDVVARVLASTRGAVTDVGSVKSAITGAIHDPRFVGGHPMAGSELEGLDGADPALFEGAVWVLTPTPATSDDAFATVARVVRLLGAEVVGLPPDRHDRVVAVVSHVPHLTAATLMGLAAARSEEHAALLRLAAGGFRDMTRIASGHPDIWLDICADNRDAIVETLDELIDGLADVRSIIATDDRDRLLSRLRAAREARANLPARFRELADVVEVRVPIPDRPGGAAEVFTLAAELGVNIGSFEVVHSAEGGRGVAVVLVERGAADLFRGGLLARGYRPAVSRLE